MREEHRAARPAPARSPESRRASASISVPLATYELLEAAARRRGIPLGRFLDNYIRRWLGLAPRTGRGPAGAGRWFWRGKWRDAAPRHPAPTGGSDAEVREEA